MWGTEDDGFNRDYSAGSMIVRKVSPDGAGARAGQRPGDRIVAVDGISLAPKLTRSV